MRESEKRQPTLESASMDQEWLTILGDLPPGAVLPAPPKPVDSLQRDDSDGNCGNSGNSGQKRAVPHRAGDSESVTESVTDTGNSLGPHTMAGMRETAAKLHIRIIQMRYKSPPSRTRAEAMAWIEDQINRLGEKCDIADLDCIPTGWTDPDDDFSDGEQITVLVQAFNELRQAGDAYPVPLPEGCTLLPEADFDPFAHGRRYDWSPL